MPAQGTKLLNPQSQDLYRLDYFSLFDLRQHAQRQFRAEIWRRNIRTTQLQDRLSQSSASADIEPVADTAADTGQAADIAVDTEQVAELVVAVDAEERSKQAAAAQ
mgnify:CR=1 FL=1